MLGSSSQHPECSVAPEPAGWSRCSVLLRTPCGDIHKAKLRDPQTSWIKSWVATEHFLWLHEEILTISRAASAASSDSGGCAVPVLPTVQSSLRGWAPCTQPAARKRWEGECARDLQGDTRLTALSAQSTFKSACFDELAMQNFSEELSSEEEEVQN